MLTIGLLCFVAAFYFIVTFFLQSVLVMVSHKGENHPYVFFTGLGFLVAGILLITL